MQTVDMKENGEVLKLARKFAGWSQDKLSAQAGLAKGTVQNIETGKTDGSPASLEKIAKAFGCEGFEELADRVHHGSTRRYSTRRSDDIPVFDEVPAGNGDFDPTELGEDNGYAVRRIPRWMTDVTDPNAYAVIVQGNSMEPKYYSGDVVICSPNAPQTSPMEAVFRLADGDCGVKVVQDIGNNQLQLTPINPNHAVRRVEKMNVLRMARVVGHYRKYQVPMNP